MAAKSHFLFLPGPPGPFFAELAGALRASGHDVSRINLSAADGCDWRGPAVRHHGPATTLHETVLAIHAERPVSHLVAYQPARPEVQSAIAALKGKASFVLFDAGYERPGWVTLEEEGTGGGSAFAQLNKEAWKKLGAGQDGPIATLLSDAKSARVAQLRYDLNNVLRSRIWEENDRRIALHSLDNLFAAAVSAIGMPLQKLLGRKENLSKEKQPTYLLVLQRLDEAQVPQYSPFQSMGEAVRGILLSFAHFAPKDAVLIARHPPGESPDWRLRRHIIREAKKHGVRDRVHFVDGGGWLAMMKKVDGAITVNSPAVLAAHRSGARVLELGKTPWHGSKLSAACSLGEFWQADESGDSELARRIMIALRRHALVQGSFFTPEGRQMLIDNLRQAEASVASQTAEKETLRHAV